MTPEQRPTQVPIQENVPDAGHSAIGSVVFAGGGTGGHIFPALAIAEAIGRNSPGVRRVMIGSDKDLDRSLLDGAVEHGELDVTTAIPARPFGIRPKQVWRLASTWGTCVRETRLVLRDERDQAGKAPVLVAMGGYVSAAPVKAALAEKCPVVLVNLDAVPGKANRWIASRAESLICVGRSTDAFEPLTCEPINPIVRAALRELPAPEVARPRFGLEPDRPTLLVTGGSQGAQTINAFVTRFADEHAIEMRDARWQVLHQAGAEDSEAVRAIYAHAGIRAEVRPFIDDMSAAWASADVSVCRAGAGTVAEAWATGTPSLFMPYPFHRDAHQRANAAILTTHEAGVLGEDQIDTEANFMRNGPSLHGLLFEQTRRALFRSRLSEMGPADGADAVARIVTALMI